MLNLFGSVAARRVLWPARCGWVLLVILGAGMLVVTCAANIETYCDSHLGECQLPSGYGTIGPEYSIEPHAG